MQSLPSIVMPERISSAAHVRVEPIRFSALDGYPLGGTLYAAESADDAANVVVFATGTGVRAAVYRWFLTYLASAGVPVLAFDYRGIGDSRPMNLRGFEAGFEDWTEYDAGAAIRFMQHRYPGARLTGIGHSIGSMIMGASDAATALNQLVFIAPHTGFFDDHRGVLRIGMKYMWRAAIRTTVPFIGYFPAHLIAGEDLPRRIALQWSASNVPGFTGCMAFADKRRADHLLQNVKRLRQPALVISFADDAWATEIGVRRFLHGYRDLLAVRRVIMPNDLGRRRIGHWGFFRRSVGLALWPFVTRFVVDQRALNAAHGQ